MERSDVAFERMRTFVRVAARGGLSAVARELGLRPGMSEKDVRFAPVYFRQDDGKMNRKQRR